MDDTLVRNGATEDAKKAAKQMTTGVLTDLKRDLVSTGAHEVVNELGYHSVAFESDKEADFLTILLIEEGLDGLEKFGNGNHPDYEP